jgi:hypothetical protein
MLRAALNSSRVGPNRPTPARGAEIALRARRTGRPLKAFKREQQRWQPKVIKVAFGLVLAAIFLVITLPAAIERFYVEPKQRALQAQERALDLEIAGYQALLPELERVTARRDALRKELLFLTELERERAERQR